MSSRIKGVSLLLCCPWSSLIMRPLSLMMAACGTWATCSEIHLLQGDENRRNLPQHEQESQFDCVSLRSVPTP